MFREVRKFFKTTGRLNQYLYLLLLRVPFDAMFTFVQAKFLRAAFTAIEQGSQESLNKVSVLFGIASCVLFLYNGTIWRAFGTMYIKLGGKLRRVMLQKISDQPLDVIERNSKGDILTRINQDAGMALQMLGGPLNVPHLMLALINLTVSSVLLCRFNLKMFLLVWLFVIPHVIINQLVITRPMAKYQAKVQKATGDLTTLLRSMILSADTAILYDAQEFLIEQYEKKSKAIFRARMKIICRNTLGSALIPMFGLGGYFVLLTVGGNSIADKTMNFGDLTAIFQLRGGVLMGAMMVISSMVNLKINMTGIVRVNEMTGGEKNVWGKGNKRSGTLNENR